MKIFDLISCNLQTFRQMEPSSLVDVVTEMSHEITKLSESVTSVDANEHKTTNGKNFN